MHFDLCSSSQKKMCSPIRACRLLNRTQLILVFWQCFQQQALSHRYLESHMRWVRCCPFKHSLLAFLRCVDIKPTGGGRLPQAWKRQDTRFCQLGSFPPKKVDGKGEGQRHFPVSALIFPTWRCSQQLHCGRALRFDLARKQITFRFGRGTTTAIK